MNHTKAMADLTKVMFGFDRFMNNTALLENFDGTYPRFNIISCEDGGKRIEIAVPGWNKSDIDISIHEGVLTVEGRKKQEINDSETYVYKGLSGKTFRRSFGVPEHVHVDRAYMERGLLCIDLHEEVPEELLPKTIAII
jgi:molecular chaperone IbpA